GLGGFQTSQQPSCQAGVCLGGNPQSCNLFACNSSFTDCLTSCSIDAHCIGSAYCTSPSCMPRLDQGQGCGGDNQCITGHCKDGVCCDTGCGGTCESCNL